MKIGDVEIEFLGHAGFLILINGKRVAIDPYNVSDDIEKVDVILITHPHFDHCSIKDIEKLSRDGTHIVMPIGAQSKVNKIDNVSFKIDIITVGIKSKVEGISIYPFPAYNIGKEFHPKNEGWIGYIIKSEEAVIYHAGDTDKIPEMEDLKYIKEEGKKFIVLLPVSGTYVMTAEEAVEVAEQIEPSISIPMHYGAGVAGNLEDAEKFVSLCKEKDLNAQVLERI